MKQDAGNLSGLDGCLRNATCARPSLASHQSVWEGTHITRASGASIDPDGPRPKVAGSLLCGLCAPLGALCVEKCDAATKISITSNSPSPDAGAVPTTAIGRRAPRAERRCRRANRVATCGHID